MSEIEAIKGLTEELNWLAPSDKAFAASLLKAYSEKGTLTAKQWPWVHKLYARAVIAAEGGSDMKSTQVGDLKGLEALFDKVKGKLKKPAIVLQVENVGAVRLTVATSRAMKPGSINVATRNETGNVWFGRVDKGVFEASRKIETPAAVIEMLKGLAVNPAGVAATHGKLTASCCFCNRALTTKESTSVGYGEICANNYGLPWGAVA